MTGKNRSLENSAKKPAEKMADPKPARQGLSDKASGVRDSASQNGAGDMQGVAGRQRRPRFAFLLTSAQRRLQKSMQAAFDADQAPHGDRAAKSHASSPARFGLLMALPADGAAMPMAKLGPQLDLGAPALSGLVDRMARDQLIIKSPDPDDGRAWQIALTQQGIAMRDAAVRNARAMNDRLCEGFDDHELEIIARWLNAIRAKYPKEN